MRLTSSREAHELGTLLAVAALFVVFAAPPEKDLTKINREKGENISLVFSRPPKVTPSFVGSHWVPSGMCFFSFLGN